MGVRSTLASILSAPTTRLLERELRELVEDVLASRPVAHAADVEALRERVELLDTGGAAPDDERVAALEAKVASLEKKLSMAMGAVQAGTSQVMGVRQAAEEAQATARQASQQATSAKSTAEAAADGVTGVEERLASLVEQLGTRPAPVSRAETEAAEPQDTSTCRVPGCTNKHRARGFCARHYQQYRRSTLEGFVGPDGVVPIEGTSFKVSKSLAGRPAAREGDEVRVDGKKVAAKAAK